MNQTPTAQEQLAQFIDEAGFDKYELTEAERATLYALVMRVLLAARNSFLSYFFVSADHLHELLFEQKDYEGLKRNILPRLVNLSEKEKDDIQQIISNFRSEVHSPLEQIGTIQREASARAGIQEMATNITDQRATPGSQIWLSEKIFFDLGNEILQQIGRA
jgi:hypothetical protein